jgi:putative endonuclease
MILGHEQRLDNIPSILMNGPGADHMDRLDEWVDYLVERLSDDPDEDEIQNVIHHAEKEYETVDQEPASRYTRCRLPVELVYQEAHASQGSALRREAAIKALPRQQKLSLMRLAG